LDTSLITQPTGHDLSIDQTTDAAATALNMNSPMNPYDMQNSSFALDDLNEHSQMVTERNDHKVNTQMSGGLMLSTLN
jgi:hypothetical protein